MKTKMPHYPSKPFMVFCGTLFVAAGYALWILAGYLVLTH